MGELFLLDFDDGRCDDYDPPHQLEEGQEGALVPASSRDDGVGSVQVLGDEIPRLPAVYLHPHAVRLRHLVVPRRRRRLPPAASPQLRLDAVQEPTQLPHHHHLRSTDGERRPAATRDVKDVAPAVS
jgi:hypothetical protein